MRERMNMTQLASSCWSRSLGGISLILAIWIVPTPLALGSGVAAQTGVTSNPSEFSPPDIHLVHPEVPRIAPHEVKQLLDKKADLVIVDTQPADGYDLWHIPTAVNIPYSSTEDSADLEAKLRVLSRDKLIVIYCLCEEGADSAMVALKLRHLGYKWDKVKVLGGGLIRWDELGYPMIKQANP